MVEKIELDDTQNTHPDLKVPETQEPSVKPKPKTKYKAIDLGSSKKKGGDNSNSPSKQNIYYRILKQKGVKRGM